jgi:hypothetical protein
VALALNIFKTVTQVVTTESVGIYTAPVGYAGVILLAQVANIGSNTQTITVSHQRSAVGISITTEIVKNCPVPGNDSLSVLDGKLILESGDVIKVSGSGSGDLKFISSILETLK